MSQTDLLQGFACALNSFIACNTAKLKRVGYVFKHRHVREQGVGLKHNTKITMPCSNTFHIATADLDASLLRVHKSGEKLQKRTLPGTGGTDHRQQFSGFDIKIDISKTAFAIRITIGDIFKTDGHGRAF